MKGVQAAGGNEKVASNALPLQPLPIPTHPHQWIKRESSFASRSLNGHQNPTVVLSVPAGAPRESERMGKYLIW